MPKYLITQEFLFENTTISQQKDMSKVKIALDRADRHYVQKMLGLKLYKLYTDYTNQTDNSITLTDDQSHVLELTKRYFAFITHFELTHELPFRTTEKGAIEPDNSVSTETRKEYSEYLYQKAELEKSDLVQFITEYPKDFEDLYTFKGKNYFGTDDYSPITW